MTAPFQYDPNSVALSPERFEELLQCERELKALEGRRDPEPLLRQGGWVKYGE
jgi:hypothetical protein